MAGKKKKKISSEFTHSLDAFFFSPRVRHVSSFDCNSNSATLSLSLALALSFSRSRFLLLVFKSSGGRPTRYRSAAMTHRVFFSAVFFKASRIFEQSEAKRSQSVWPSVTPTFRVLDSLKRKHQEMSLVKTPPFWTCAECESQLFSSSHSPPGDFRSVLSHSKGQGNIEMKQTCVPDSCVTVYILYSRDRTRAIWFRAAQKE